MKYSDYKNGKNASSNKKEDEKTLTYAEYKEQYKDKVSYNVGEDDFNNFVNDLNSFFTSASKDSSSTDYGNAQDRSSKYSQSASSLRERADYLSGYIHSNKSRMSEEDYKRYMSMFDVAKYRLNSVERGYTEIAKFYSQFETKGDYDGWVMTNTVEKTDADSVKKRQDAYTSVNNRIKQIDDQIASLDVSDGYTANEELIAEKERLQNYIRQYERGSKDKDIAFAENASKKDYAKKSANRDFDNPEYSDIEKWYTYTYGGEVVNNETGAVERIDYKPKDYDSEAEKENLIINDPLGFYHYIKEQQENGRTQEEYSYHPFGTMGEYDFAKLTAEAEAGDWDQLKEEEIEMYYYLLNDQGVEAAKSFLDGMTTELNYRATEEFRKEVAEADALSKVFYNIVSIPANIIGGGVAFVDDTIDLLTGNEINPYDAAHGMKNYADIVLSETASDLNELTNNGEFLGMTAGDAYQSLKSGADSFVGASVFGPAYMALMVAGAASSGVKDLYERGASTEQIISGAAINGAAEYLGEKIPLDNFLKMKGSTKGPMDLIVKTLLQGGYELGGEMTTEITNIVGEAINLRSESEWAKLLEENDGAFWETVKELATDKVWKAGAGGFISGMLMGGAQTTADYAQNQSAFKAEGQSILEQGGVDALKSLALDMAGEQNGISNFARKSLQKQAGKVSSEVHEGEGLGGRISAAVKNSRNAKAVGKLSATVQEAISSKNISEITSDLRKGGMSKGEATKIANEFMSVVENGGELSTELQDAIDNSLVEGTALGKSWVSVFGKDSAVTSRVNRYQMARHGIEVDSKGELTEEGEKAVTKKMNDKLGITGTVETEAEGFEVNPDGENIAMSSGNGIETLAFVDTDDGIKIKVSDTDSVSASDVSYKNGATAAIFSAVTSLGADASASNEIASMFSGITDEKQAVIIGSDMALAYKYGKLKMGESYLGKLDSLTPQQAKIIYNKGREQAILHRDAEGAKVKSAVEESKKDNKTDKNTAKKIGNLVLAKDISTDAKRRTGIQNANILVADAMAKVTGTEIYVGQSSLGKDGKRTWTLPDGTVVGANGLYLPGKIYLDINAGANGEGIMVESLGHELGHHIKRYNPTAFGKIADYLMEQFEANGHDVRGMIQDEIRKIEARGEAKTEQEIEEEAHEEFVCQAFVGMLQDGTVAKSLADLKKNDYSVWQVIMDAIKDLLDKWGLVIKEYDGRELSTAEGQALASMKDVFKKVQEMYIEALQGANENFEALGIHIDTDTNSVSPMLSERTWTESEYVQERDKAAWAIKTSLGVDIKTAYQYIDDINSVARLIADDRVRLDYEPNLDSGATVLKPNSEYKYTVDMSTLCAKRLLFTGTFDAIQRALPNTVFDSEDIVGLREMMQKRNLEVACGICYVESTRREIGRITQEFIDRYKVAQKSGKPISRINSKGEEVVLKSGGRTFSADKSYTPNLGELNTTDIDLVKRDHREVYDAYLAFMNARRQAKPKLLETRAEYKGEILKHFKSKSAVKARNNAGGLRLQSFSDFEAPHLIDMMQVVMDMSRVGLKSQAYTKVPAFAEAFGNTGVKINLSIIAKDSGLDANGNLIFDDVEGINHEEAFRLRDKFSKNVGTILVGKNDAHIIAAMADPRIDFIIPFHKSSWKESLYDALGLTGYDDYTDYQNEKAIDGSSIKNYDPSEYWDFSKSGDENAQIYLQKCKEDGRIPKFPQFQGYPGYWKLLIDFKMYDNNGVGSPQEVVRPIFDNATNEKILNDYKGGHRNFPVAKDVVDDFVKQYKAKSKTSKIDLSKAKAQERDTAYMDAVNRGDMETAQRMVDEAAREAGYPVKAYHGTNQGNFTKFLWDKTQRADGGFYGRGHYFTTSKSMAKMYGSRVVDAFLNVGKTFVWSENVNEYNGQKPPELLSRNIVSRINMAKLFPDLFANNTMSYFEYDSNTGKTVENKIKWKDLEHIVQNLSNELELKSYANGTYRWHTEGRFWDVPVGDVYSTKEDANDGKFFAAINALKEKYDGILSNMSFDDQTTYVQYNGSEITDLLKKIGYESAMDTPDGGEIVVFDSSQVKSADPVTYDDDGNVIPLSKRFDKSNKDIRYQERDFSYDELVAKGDLTGTIVDKSVQVKLNNGIIDNAWVVKEVKKKCQTVSIKGGKTYYVDSPDIGRNVEVISDGITHGFSRPNDRRNGKSTPKAIINARVSLVIPELLKNSIEVNRSKRGNSPAIPYTHVMIGTVGLEDNNGNVDYYAVRSMIQERANQDPILVDVNVLGRLTSVNAKKIDSPNVQVNKNVDSLAYGRAYRYNIADFLNDVKGVFDNTFSEV